MKKIALNSSKLLLSAAIIAQLGACAGKPSWEKRYEESATPIMEEYHARAVALTADPSKYRFHFRLLFANDSKNQFTLHANYPNGIAELTDIAKADIVKEVASLKTRKDIKNLRIEVVGHTDSSPIGGSLRDQFPDNQALSLERARQVALFLREHLGLPESAVGYTGAGAAQPIADNGSPDGRAQNRRVEVQPQFGEHAIIEVVNDPEKELHLTEIPADYVPWWQPLVTEQMNPKVEKRTFQGIEEVLLRALKHSNQIHVFSDLPLIRETVIDEAKGKFDTHVFVEGKYGRIDKPTGSLLETGGPLRFEEDEWTLEAGLRKKLITGGELEVSEKIGERDNNSEYFNPHQQGNAKLALTFRQPLLNGAGFEYNESQIEVAKVDQTVSMDEFMRQVSAHLLEVERAYWALYLERANLLQKKRLFTDAEKVVAELEYRRGIDALASQVTQARAELVSRYAASVRSEQAVRNAEGKLLSLINDPSLLANENFELVTSTSPKMLAAVTDVTKAAEIALSRRPEILQAFRQMKAGTIRAHMSENELLPILNLVVETSLHGLRGDYDTGGAMSDQFDPMKLNYNIGLLLDIPLGNRVAEARHRRRLLEVRQLTNQLRTSIETIFLEVQVSVRELDTAYREMLSQYQAMLAYKSKLATLEERRSLSLGQTDQSQYLKQLLDGQAEVATAEQAFLSSYVAYNIAHSNLDRAAGVFLEARQITSKQESDQDTGLPVLKLEQNKDRQPVLTAPTERVLP